MKPQFRFLFFGTILLATLNSAFGYQSTTENLNTHLPNVMVKHWLGDPAKYLQWDVYPLRDILVPEGDCAILRGFVSDLSWGSAFVFNANCKYGKFPSDNGSHIKQALLSTTLRVSPEFYRMNPGWDKPVNVSPSLYWGLEACSNHLKTIESISTETVRISANCCPDRPSNVVEPDYVCPLNSTVDIRKGR